MHVLAKTGPESSRASSPRGGGWTRAVVTAVLVCVAGHAFAQGVGWTEAARYKGWTVTSLKIEGIDHGLATQLKRGLALSGQARLIGTRKVPLFTRTLQEDLQRCELFLARHGHPHARIEPRFEPDDEGRKLKVVLMIEPGPAVVVESVTVTGLPPALAADFGGDLMVRKGSVLIDAKVEETVQALASRLKKAGYPRATVAARVIRGDSVRAALNFEAEPGEQSRFGEALVTGVPDDLVPLVGKTIAVRKGALYSPVVVQRADESLRGLGLFRQIRLGWQDAGPGVVDVRADLSPRKFRSAEVGVGYYTDDYLRGSARWQHRNFLRAGRGLEVRAAASRFQQEGLISLWWPALLGTRTRASTLLDVTHENEDSYELMNSQLELALTYRFSLATSVRAGVAVSDVNVTVKTDEPGAFREQGGLLTIFSLKFSRDSSDDRLYPTRGTVTWLTAEWAPSGFLSESHYVKLETYGSWYQTILGPAVLAARLNMGVAKPVGTSVDLLPNKRFYAGGSSSMRGAGRRKLGPLDAAGAPLGGELKALGSAELRFPLYKIFQGAWFVDTGQVWRTRDLADWKDLEVAIGPGLMVRTPVGPVRVDVGYDLTERPAGQARTVMHLSIGNPF
jgi:outer membrane protein assembly factor BamA